MESQEQKCLAFDEIERYLAGDVSEEETIRIDAHMGTCDDCAEKVRMMRRLNFLFNQWTAKSHVEIYQQEQLVAALNKAAEQNPILKERIHRWLEKWAGKAEAALRLVMKVPEETTRIITEGVEALVKPDSRLKFVYITAPVPTRGVETLKEKKTVVKTEGIPNVQVIVNEAANEVEVRLKSLPSEQKAPLILLIPDAKEQAPLLSEPKPEPKTNYHIARFQNVPAGKYTLVFEPME